MRAEIDQTTEETFAVPLQPGSAKDAFDEIFPETAATEMFEPRLKHAIEAALDLSPFLRESIRREADFLITVSADRLITVAEEIIADTLEGGKSETSESDFMQFLRVAKRRIALVCGIADLGGFWETEEVTRTLSNFAKASLAACIDYVFLQAHQNDKLVLVDPENPQHECGLIVLGMGKFGADELNYSSDIDAILFFDEEAGISLNTDDPMTLLVRMGKQLVKLMQERTSDGYVFRTDLRLRPDPSSTPIVIPVDAALNYYEGQGQNWERAAMIKATAVAGDIKAGERFLRQLAPFVWRKYLDFAAIQDVHSIKRQIHAHKGHGKIAVQGHNVKLGRGGIREIEFFVQTQQLIAGGRNPNLRQKRTVDALAALVDHGWIEAETAQELRKAYWFLRDVEHRLQMVEDTQTHSLPDNSKDLQIISAMFGMSEKEFSKRVERTLRQVEQHYSELFETAPGLTATEGNLVFTGNEEDPGTVETLQELGFANPGKVISIVKHWHVAKLPALQASAAREMLTELVPDLLQAFSKSDEPDAVLYTFDRFISGLPAGIQLFAILKSNPALNALLVKILIAAPALADQIAQKPHVFDAMLEPQSGAEHFSRERLEDALSSSLAGISDFELKLDQARRFFREIRFQIACRFVGGGLEHKNVAVSLSNLADALITVMFDEVCDEFRSVHGEVEGSKTCIIAMGRLGSRELTANSDLDLIFLYDFPEDINESTGPKPLDPTLYFIRLLKRFITAMSAPTAEGLIYQLDFRLRPSGNAGPLATQVDGFLKYQRNEAWIWEAQALTRARPVHGNKAICEMLTREIPEILKRHQDEASLKSEIHKMRMLIEQEKGTSNVWDVKTGNGGLLDIEFIAQWLVLNFGPAHSTATADILAKLGNEHLSPDNADRLIAAYDTLSLVLHLQRTCLGDVPREEELPDGFGDILCTALDLPDIALCKAHILELKKTTRTSFEEILGSGKGT